MRIIIKLCFLLIVFQFINDASAQRLSLDGTWQILVDPANEGKELGWMDPEIFSRNPEILEIKIPSGWEEVVEDYEGVAFFLRKFQVPDSWEGKTVELCFGAVNYLAEVWLNNEPIGQHEGGFTPFRFQVGHVIKPGEENILIMRVTGPILLTEQRIDGVGRYEVPQWRGAITGGIWQSVELKTSGEILIDDIFVKSDIKSGKVSFQLDIENTIETAVNAEIKFSIYTENNALAASLSQDMSFLPGSNKSNFELIIPEARLWSPDSPYLYRIEAVISNDGAIMDRKELKFGLREFTIKNNEFYLNDKPFYLKGAFFEGLYPVKLAYPDSREMALREIKLAKDAGFNMIRPWRKPPPPMWLDLCDSLGIMTIGSLAVECMGKPIATPQLPQRVMNELRESIIRDRNRTCVIMWELFNELEQPMLIQMLHPMSLLARELDPTRLILDESGGWARGARMYLPYSRIGQQFNDIHNYAGSQICEDRFNGYLSIGTTELERADMGYENVKIPGKNVVPGRMSFVSEMGYGSLPNLEGNNQQFRKMGNPILPATKYHQKLENDLKEALRKTGLDTVYSDFEMFCLHQQKMHGIANKRMVEATRCNPNVKGYCIHALTDGDWILGAGIIDLWRNPKSDAYKMTKEANNPKIVVIRVLPRNIYSGNVAELTITGVNELENIPGWLSVKIFHENGEEISQKEVRADLGAGITEMLKMNIETENYSGEYVINVEFIDSKKVVVCSNEAHFSVFNNETPAFQNQSVQLIDPTGSLIPFLNKNGIDFTFFDEKQNRKTPLIVGKIPENDLKYKELVKSSIDYVKDGGFVVFLQVPGKPIPFRNRVHPEIGADELPFGARMLNTRGSWVGRPHIVKNHPIFAGLPVNMILHGAYENVHPDESMIKQEGEYLCGVISYDHYVDMDRMLRHYNGPGEVWWGANLLLTPHGRGQILLSTFKIIENLGIDPVADRLLFNMIQFAYSSR